VCSWVATAAVLASASTARMSSVLARNILGLPEDALNDRGRLVIGGGRTLDAVLSRDSPAVVDRHFSQRGRRARLFQVIQERPETIGIDIGPQTALEGLALQLATKCLFP